jgi:hypothetical protein
MTYSTRGSVIRRLTLLAVTFWLAGCGNKQEPNQDELLIAQVQFAASTCDEVFGFTPVLNKSAKHRPRSWYSGVTKPIDALGLDLDMREDESTNASSRGPSLLQPQPTDLAEYHKAKAAWIATARQPYLKAQAGCQQLFTGKANPIKLEMIETRLSYKFDTGER